MILPNRKKNSLALDILALALVIAAFLIIMAPSVGSGYHLVDDHEIILISKNLSANSSSVLSVASQFIKEDMKVTHRFRPMYFFGRVLQVRLFGPNFLTWHVFVAILGVVTAYCLYVTGRLVGFSFLQSILFSAQSLIGPQLEIWWRLGPNETYGVLFLSISLIFCFLGITIKKYRYLPDIAFIISVIIMSLFKESFVLLIPALIFLRIWFYMRKNVEMDWQDAARQNLILIFTLPAVFIAEIFTIFFYVGISGVGYAGVDSSSFSIFALLPAVFQILWSVKFYLAPFIALLIFLIEKRRYGGNIFKVTLTPILFLALWIAPQIFLYTKSGFKPRYLLPSTVGFAFFNIYIWNLIDKIKIHEDGAPQLSEAGSNPIAGVIIALIVILALMQPVYFSFLESVRFGLEGKALNNMLADLNRKAGKNNLIVLASVPGDSYEKTYSIELYLSTIMGNRKTYLFPIFNNSQSEYEKHLVKNLAGTVFKKRLFSDIKNRNKVAAVMFIQGRESYFISESKDWFNGTAFTRNKYQGVFSLKFRGNTWTPVTGNDFVAYYKRRGLK